MSAPPDGWVRVHVQGKKTDLSPDATVENICELVRHLIAEDAIEVPGGKQRRDTFTARRYAVVRKRDVGTDSDGNWNTPASKEQIVEYDLASVTEGDDLRLYGAPPEWEPVYPEVHKDG